VLNIKKIASNKSIMELTEEQKEGIEKHRAEQKKITDKVQKEWEQKKKKAKELIDLDQFKESMQGIYSTSVRESTIDESPFAYKAIEDIIDNVEGAVEIKDIIKPIYNFKA